MDGLWGAAQHSGPSLLHRVDPTKGLKNADFSTLANRLRIRAASSWAVVADTVGLNHGGGSLCCTHTR
jgi:hypothetical protein